MPLITCPDCRKARSDAAAACPHCGCPHTVSRPKPAAPQSHNARPLVVLVGILFGLILIAAVVNSVQDARDEEATQQRLAADRRSVELADASGTLTPGPIAVGLDEKAHRLAMTHPAIHEAAARTHLDSAEARIARHADLDGITDELTAGSAHVSDSLTQRAAVLRARVKPRLDADAAKRAAADAAAGKALRVAYARTYEESLLDKGINATVTTSGPGATHLTMKWALVSRVVAHQYAKGDIIGEMRRAGFTRFAITDGYDETWTWDLSK